MSLLKLILSKTKEIKEIYERHGFSDPAVFGSIAREEELENSDIDLLYRFQTGTYFDLIRMEKDLFKTFNRKIDLCNRDRIVPIFKPYIERDVIELS